MILNMTLQNYLNETLHQKDRVNSLVRLWASARPLLPCPKDCFGRSIQAGTATFLMVPMPGL